jgi:glucose-1-phosphate cytidylyltransferase
MKVGILAGGLGTRLSEETTVKPKPMVEIGGKPILWHIMKIYATYGFNEFVIALGYKGELIKDYFINYHYRARDLSVNLRTGEVTLHNSEGENWIVHLLDTGLKTATGGRVKQIAEFIGNESFMLTYGDGVSNIDVRHLCDFHKTHGKLATITSVRPPARFGQMAFQGGFFVLEPGIVDYIEGDQTAWEGDSLERLASEGQLIAYQHNGFWHCMDTLRDVNSLEKYWLDGNAPWKIWG